MTSITTSNNLNESDSQYILGLPKHLLWGFVAIAIFMAGDGFEMAFLSSHITSLGFTASQASAVIAVYGFAVAIAAWSTGVVAEIITPQKSMRIGVFLWIIMHVLFMLFGLGHKNFTLMILFYGVRGLAYPLFLYSFVMMIVQTVPASRVSGAMGWFWSVYSIGMGVLGSYLPSITISLFNDVALNGSTLVGETRTLWFSTLWVTVGGLIAIISMRNISVDTSKSKLPLKDKLTELTRAVTILFTDKNIFICSYIRIVNTISLFGFPIIMPLILKSLGITLTQWLEVWAVFFFVTIFTNIFWGVMSDHINWMKQMRWFGCIGMALSTLFFYYVPTSFPEYGFILTIVSAVLLGIFVAAFVPMTALFTILEPNHKGAAISIYTLSAGLSNFFAPLIASAILVHYDDNILVGAEKVVWAYTAMYLIAAVASYFVKYVQPVKAYEGQ